jgi:hypothetical protein
MICRASSALFGRANVLQIFCFFETCTKRVARQQGFGAQLHPNANARLARMFHFTNSPSVILVSPIDVSRSSQPATQRENT